MTPLMNSSAPSVVKRSSRYARRFSSVDSTPIESKRFLIVPSLSSAARIPFPSATSCRAVVSRSVASIVAMPIPPVSRRRDYPPLRAILTIAERGQEPVQRLEVRAKVVDTAKGVRDCAQGARGITVELGKPPLEALELRAQDERAGPTFLRELS